MNNSQGKARSPLNVLNRVAPADGLGQGFAPFPALKARYRTVQSEGLGSFAPPAAGALECSQRSQRGHLHSLAEARESGRDYRTPKRSVIREAVWSAGSPLPLFPSPDSQAVRATHIPKAVHDDGAGFKAGIQGRRTETHECRPSRAGWMIALSARATPGMCRPDRACFRT